MMKENQTRSTRLKGFTLVELIVVIAIIGVLAGILVPSMLGYVKMAKISGANSSAKTLFNAAMSACREQDVTKPIKKGVYTYQAGVEGAVDSTSSEDDSGVYYNAVICHYIYDYFASAESADWAVKIEYDVPVGAAIRKSTTDQYIGTYPCGNTEAQANIALLDAVEKGQNGW